MSDLKVRPPKQEGARLYNGAEEEGPALEGGPYRALGAGSGEVSEGGIGSKGTMYRAPIVKSRSLASLGMTIARMRMQRPRCMSREGLDSDLKSNS
jgi:hypothetical protein